MKLIEGNKYVVITSVKNGVIKTKEVIYDGEFCDMQKGELRAMIKNSRVMYYPWELFASKEAAIKDYINNIHERIKCLRQLNKEAEKEIEKRNISIDKCISELNQLKLNNFAIKKLY